MVGRRYCYIFSHLGTYMKFYDNIPIVNSNKLINNNSWFLNSLSKILFKNTRRYIKLNICILYFFFQIKSISRHLLFYCLSHLMIVVVYWRRCFIWLIDYFYFLIFLCEQFLKVISYKFTNSSPWSIVLIYLCICSYNIIINFTNTYLV